MKSALSFFLLALICTDYSFAQADYLIPYRDGNKWGYADTSLRIVIPVQFDRANKFFNGYARIESGKKNGLIDKTGKMLLLGDFSIDNPSDGVAAIDKDDKVGLADVVNGQILLEPVYKGNFSYGPVSAYIDEAGKHGLYDKKLKKWLLPVKYQDISMDFIDHYITVLDGQKKRYYSFSPAGQLTSIPGPVKKAPVIEESNSKAVRRNYPEKLEEAWIGTGPVIEDGNLPAGFEKLGWVGSMHPLLMGKKEGKKGLIDTRGNIKVPFIYDDIKTTERSEIDSIYMVKKDGKWGLTQYEKLLLPCEYDEVKRSSYSKDGFYLKQGTKQGFYAYTDEIKLYNKLIPCKYEGIGIQVEWVTAPDTNKEPFYIIEVYTNGYKSGYVDMKGNEYFK